QVEAVREPARPAHCLRARPHRGTLPCDRAGALRCPHRSIPGARAAGGPLRAPPALRVPRSAARRRVRLGDVRAGDPARRTRAARLDERPPDPRGAADLELAEVAGDPGPDEGAQPLSPAGRQGRRRFTNALSVVAELLVEPGTLADRSVDQVGAPRVV